VTAKHTGFHGNKFTHNNRGTVENSNFYIVCAKELYIQDTSQAVVSCVEARFNTLTVALRVVEGDGKASLESEAVKYGRKSHRIQT
jgi:hypothetical protein